MTSIRVVLADDHSLVYAGIRALLENIEGVAIVAEASDGRAALQAVAEHQPDVVLMDIAMASLNGLEATARLMREHPAVRVVILSMHANEEYVLRALQAGAIGYLLKDADPAELELAVRAAARGEAYLSPAVSRHLIADYVRRVGQDLQLAESLSHGLSLLTPRQREVLQLIAEGRTTREIARILNISIKTVETHRAQLMERLDIHDVAGLVRYAIRAGLTQE